MAGFITVVAEMVGAALVQEVVNRTVSSVLGKRKEKASQGQYLERLKKAVNEVEFVLERTEKMPITEVSLLRDRIELKRDFIDAAALLVRQTKRQAPQDHQDISQAEAAVTGSSSSQPWVTRPAMFPVSSFISMMTKDDLRLSCDDVDRFEQFADSARKIQRDVESGCSLRRYMFFPCSLVRRLFRERKTLFYRAVQADQERHFNVWPSHLEEERGVEVRVRYCYLDRRRPDKSFSLRLVLRLSESTDIVGIAIKCLQLLASQFNFVADAAMGELSVLASSLQDISHSHAPLWVGFQQRHIEISQMFRPDPLCCKSKGHEPYANKVVPSKLSHVFPEEVIGFAIECYSSAPEYSLRSSSAHEVDKRSVLRKRGPPLQLAVCLAPHYVCDEWLQASYVAERIGHNDEEERIDISMQQVGETVRSGAINCFLRQPKVKQYKIRWVTKHGTAWFLVENPRARVLETSGMSKS
ncbi:unnamed protein product [Urochloa decumbens]|uniref:Rx N-terminal domain-containing protein n=1 Tax=Urochloa decumbens TaxID=240449 RepID=A0ABC9FLB6_9POAL